MSTDDQNSDPHNSSGFKLCLAEDSSSDDETLGSIKKKLDEKEQLINDENSDDSGDSSSARETKQDEDKKAKEKVEDETNDVASDSENANMDSGKENRKRKRSTDSESSTNSHSHEDQDNEKNKKKKRKGDGQSGKTPKGESSKILRLKKYLTVAGIKIRNYSKIFEDCKSKKSKELKLLSIFEKEGLKGKPTIEKCKKLRKKIERRREIEELDVDNIISVHDSTTRLTRITRNRLPSSEKPKNETDSKMSVNSEIFGNLSGIIDSEGSDDDQNQPKKQNIKKRCIVDSD